MILLDAEVKSLGAKEKLYCHNIGNTLEYLQGHPAGYGCHAYMILVVLNGWDAVDTGWVCEPLALAC